MGQVAYYTPESRAETLNKLTLALSADQERVAGMLLVGSGVLGFRDDWSDLDVAVVVPEGMDAIEVFHTWAALLPKTLPVLWVYSAVRGEQVGLLSILLQDYLEVDITFQPLSALGAYTNWKVLFDRTGRVDAVMRSRALPEPTPLLETYNCRLDSIWYFVTHAVLCLRRGRLWEALHYVGELRERTIEIEKLLTERTTSHQCQIDDLPRDRLASLEGTLVRSIDHDEIGLALRCATRVFFDTAQRVEQECEVQRAEPLRIAMEQYLDACGIWPDRQ